MRNRIGALFAFAMGISLASAAYADDWVMLGPGGKAPHRRAWFIDRSTVKSIDGNKRVWLQMINETPDAPKDIKSMKSLVEIDCSQMRERTLSTLMFDHDKMLGRSESKADFTFIAPDTPIAQISEMVCRNDYKDAMPAGKYTPEILAQATFSVFDDNGKIKK